MTQENTMQQTLAQPSRVTLDDLRAWLARHDVSLSDVRRMEFICAAPLRGVEHASSVYLRVERFLRDSEGQKFSVVENGDRVVAAEQILIPILDLP